MEAYEHILPENETIDKKVELQRSELESKFQISIAEAGDILDLSHENIRPTEKFLEFSSIVAKTLVKDGDPEAIRDAIYRSVCFGAQICDYLLPSEYTCNLPEYINKRTDKKASIAPIVDDSQGYLARRPHLKAMVVTNNTFSRPARELAADSNCILIDREILSDWIVKFQSDKTRG